MNAAATGARFVRWAWRDAGAMAALVRAALVPAAAVYRTGVALRNGAYDAGLMSSRALPVPSIGVGNLAVGGTGKTPVASWLARSLSHRGLRAGILLRGYGGDEGELHLGEGVLVETGADRHASAGRAVRGGAEVLVLDDALQRRDVKTDAMLALVSGDTWEGLRWPVPAGPWREGLRALGRADCVVVTHKLAGADEALRLAERLAPRTRHGAAATIGIAPESLEPLRGGASRPVSSLSGTEVVAVAGVGEPELFAGQLLRAGARVRPLAFPDHHVYREEDVARIAAEAGAGRPVVTTAKDAVKLRGMWPESGPVCLVANAAVTVTHGREVLQGIIDRVAGMARQTSSKAERKPPAGES